MKNSWCTLENSLHNHVHVISSTREFWSFMRSSTRNMVLCAGKYDMWMCHREQFTKLACRCEMWIAGAAAQLWHSDRADTAVCSCLATSNWFEAPCDPLSRFYLGVRPTVMVVDPEMIKQITVKEFSSFMDREVSHGNMNMGSSLCRGPWTLLSLMAFMLARHMTALSSALTSLTRLGRLHDLCLNFWSVVDPWHKEVFKCSTHLKFTVSGLSMIRETYAPRVQCRLTRLA